PMFLFSGAFFPVTQLPDGIEWLAYVTPLWHGVMMSRDLSLGVASFWPTLGHAAYLLVWIGAGTWLTGRGLRRGLVRLPRRGVRVASRRSRPSVRPAGG